MAKVLMLVANPAWRDPRVNRAARALVAAGHTVRVHGVRSGDDDVPSGLTFEVILGQDPFGWFRRFDRQRRGSASVAATVQQTTRLSWASRTVKRLLREQLRAVWAGLQFFLATKGLWSQRELMVGWRPDVVHAHDLNVLGAAAAVARSASARLVFDSHEVWSELGNYPKWYRAVMRFLERRWIRGQVDALIVVSESMRHWFESAYAVRDAVVITNAPDESPVPRVDSSGVTGRPLRVLYQGSFSHGRGLLEIIRGSRDLPTSSELVLRGSGPLLHLVRTECAGQGERVRLLPPVPPDQVVAGAARDGDVGLVLFTEVGVNYDVALPNKLFEYFLAGLPVIATRRPELVAFGSRFGGIVYVDDAGPSEIRRAVEEVLQPGRLASLRSEVDLARAAGEAGFSASSARLVQLYSTLLSDGRD